MRLFFPEKYNSHLSAVQTLEMVELINRFFSDKLAEKLNLSKVPGPLVISQGSGISDNLDNYANPVFFEAANTFKNNKLEIVRSVTKWKRAFLADLKFETGTGIYSEIAGIRPDEEISNLHSIQVHQWDWEQIIAKNERNFETLKNRVEIIYECFRETENQINNRVPEFLPKLPEKIHFIHSEELLQMFPALSPEERENRIAKNFGAVFIVGIGGKLSDGKVHGIRMADYDDWSTANEQGFRGLNGDILFWNPVLNRAMEISSMGIRVDKNALMYQIKQLSCEEIIKQPWHQKLINEKLPQTIGGGIGQSRLNMFLLQKAHIGEVLVTEWPQKVRELCKSNNVNLL